MKMQATLEQGKRLYTMKWKTMQLCQECLYDICKCKTPSKLQCEILQHNVSACVCVCDMRNEERALLLKKNGWLETRGKIFDQWWNLKVRAIPVHKCPPMRKKKALNFESGG